MFFQGAVKVEEIMPLPALKLETEPRGTKMRSQIFTASPQRIKLEEVARRRQKKQSTENTPSQRKDQQKVKIKKELKRPTKKSARLAAKRITAKAE